MDGESQGRFQESVMPVAITLLGLGAALTLLALFARVAWIPELATHFRFYYLWLLGVLAVVFLLSRRPRLALVAALFAIPNAWYAAPYLASVAVAPSVAAPRGDTDVSLIALNLLYANENHAAVREYLRDGNPDVLVLSELTPVWRAALREVLADFPYGAAEDRVGSWGLGVFSRYPMRELRASDLGMPGSHNISTVLALPGRDLHLLGVHLASPTLPQRLEQRNRQLAGLAALLAGTSDAGDAPARMVLGDLNVTPFSPYFRDFLAATGLVDAALAGDAGGTWPAWMPLVRIPIDHCLVDPGLPVSDVRPGPYVGSDHLPLEVTLRLGG